MIPSRWCMTAAVIIILTLKYTTARESLCKLGQLICRHLQKASHALCLTITEAP